MSAPLEHTLLAITFDKHEDTPRYLKVPPHITVMPWFDNRRAIVDSVVDYTISTTEPFAVRRGEPMVIGGAGHEKPAVTVVSEDLLRLHKLLFEKLVAMGVKFSHPQWLGENYVPHYKGQESGDPFEEADEIEVSDIAVINNLSVVGLDKGMKEITYRKLGLYLGRA